MILRFAASWYYFKLDKTTPLQHTLGSTLGHPKRRLRPDMQGYHFRQLEEPFDPASGKTERELQSFAYFTIFKDIISSIELLQWRKDRNMRPSAK